jgi:hypothetical protein
VGIKKKGASAEAHEVCQERPMLDIDVSKLYTSMVALQGLTWLYVKVAHTFCKHFFFALSTLITRTGRGLSSFAFTRRLSFVGFHSIVMDKTKLPDRDPEVIETISGFQPAHDGCADGSTGKNRNCRLHWSVRRKGSEPGNWWSNRRFSLEPK